MTDSEYKKFVLEEAARFAKEEGGTEGTQGAPGQAGSGHTPITLTLDGQQYTYATQEEASAAVSAAIQGVRQFAAEANKKPGSFVTSDDQRVEEKFDNAKWRQLMNENPIEAYDYVDKFRGFGKLGNKPAEAIAQKLEKLDKMEEALRTQTAVAAARAFAAAHPEFDPNKHSGVVDQIRVSQGLPLTQEALEYSLYLAQQRGAVPTRETWEQASGQQTQQTQHQFTPQWNNNPVPQTGLPAGNFGPTPGNRPSVPPFAGRSTGAPEPNANLLEAARSIGSIEELAKFVEKVTPVNRG